MKKTKFLGASTYTNEISETIRQGQDQSGDINVEFIPINRIEVDVENPRRTGFTFENINNPDQVIKENQNLLKIYEGLKFLADSIKSVGIQQPIKVYRHRDKFRIAYGERRFLASIIAEQPTIPAWILHEKPKHLRTIQYIENMQRAELTTWERIQNVQAILAESQLYAEEQITVTSLSELLGMSRSRASHYLVIINGPDDVKTIIQNGAINNLEKGAYLSRIKSDIKRQSAAKLLLDGAEIKEIDKMLEKSNQKEETPHSSTTHQRGRPVSRINLGQTTNVEIIRKIMASIPISSGENQDYLSVDWNDLKSVTRHWKLFLKHLEVQIMDDSE